MPSSLTLTLILVNGTARGVITAEIGNWSGKALAAPRAELPALVRREEIKNTGMYILAGTDPDKPSRKRVYVGQSDNLRSRLQSHDRDGEKEFFTHVYVLVSTNLMLTKSRVQYLEAATIRRIASERRAELDTVQCPEPPNLPEADTVIVEGYLQMAEVIIPVLGFDVLRPVKQADAPDIFELTGSSKTQARARVIDGEFTLLAGSQLREQSAASLPAGIVDRRKRLIDDGDAIKDQDGGHYKLTRDIPCTSPSQAANIVSGYKVKTRDVWKLEGEDDMTYGDWREKQFKRSAN